MSSDKLLIFLLSRVIIPLSLEILLGSNRIKDKAIVVFPQPDSPTIPRASPALIWKETLFTAFTVPFVTL